MSYYRHMYAPNEVDEDSYFQHRLALAGQGDMMELARLHRMHDVDLTSSFMRYAPSRVGYAKEERLKSENESKYHHIQHERNMISSRSSHSVSCGDFLRMYQDLNSVYQEDCNVPIVTLQSSFNTDESLQNQNYPVYSYGASVPPQSFTSTPATTQVNLQQASSSQPASAMGLGSENPRVIHDLSTIARRSDLEWLTTTSTEIRTQSPLNTSSPRPPMYPSQPTPPNIALNLQGIIEDRSSSATSGHHHFRVNELTGNSRTQARSNKKTSSSNPMKPKGTPGRKRKFQDHELTPEEATKRRIRRERNKVAAAKCRNRRRELTDRLQGETDNLEDHQTQLQQEIYSLQQEKEHLEFLLSAHTPNCKAIIRAVENVPLVPDEENRGMINSYSAPLSTVDEIMTGSVPENQFYYHPTSLSSHRIPETTVSQQEPLKTSLTLESPMKLVSAERTQDFTMTTSNAPTDLSSRSNNFSNTSNSSNIVPAISLESIAEESINTPVCNLTTPTYTTGIFTFPTTPNTCSTTTDISFTFPSSIATMSKTNSTLSSTFMAPPISRPSPLPQTCSLAHRRRSSSDSLTSPDSVKSHNLLAL